MVERQDIDALLISALYGELTPSQESELTTHLASHPADKAALEGLTLTRDQVRSSRILSVQVEPPQSVSALLIQEAARRAPKKAPAEGEGWFARFVRSFVQHPAMAAAAMLVLVVGIAAVVGRNKGNEFASESQDVSLSEKSAAAPKADSPVMEGGAANQVAQNAEPAAAAPTAVPTGGAAAGSGSSLGYMDTGSTRETAKGALRGGDQIGMGVTLAEERQQKADTADGIVINRRPEAPKELAQDEKKLVKEATRERDLKAKDQNADKQSFDDGDSYRDATAKPGAGASGAGAASPPPPPPPPPPAQPTQQYATPPSDVRANNAPTTPTTTAVPRNVAPAAPIVAEPKSEPAKKSPAPAKTETKALEQKPVEAPKADIAKNEKSDPTTEWARSQYAVLVSKARAGECNAAAELAVSIENRAPSFYAQNIANDRDLKACNANIAAAREKEAEKRAAAERAKKSGAEPKAAKKATTETK